MRKESDYGRKVYKRVGRKGHACKGGACVLGERWFWT